jgi:ATP-dependent Clp protease ATP-binding subunit ClpA
MAMIRSTVPGPLRRYIAHEVETKLGRALLRGYIAAGGTVDVNAEKGELTVSYARAEAGGLKTL